LHSKNLAFIKAESVNASCFDCFVFRTPSVPITGQIPIYIITSQCFVTMLHSSLSLFLRFGFVATACTLYALHSALLFAILILPKNPQLL